MTAVGREGRRLVPDVVVVVVVQVVVVRSQRWMVAAALVEIWFRPWTALELMFLFSVGRWRGSRSTAFPSAGRSRRLLPPASNSSSIVACQQISSYHLCVFDCLGNSYLNTIWRKMKPRSIRMNSQNALLRKNRFTEPTRKIWMKVDPYYQRQNVGQWF